MPEIRDYPEATSLLASDALILDRLDQGTMQIAGGSVSAVSGAVATVASYSALRSSSFGAGVTSIVLDDGPRSGLFVRVAGTTPVTRADNGGTVLMDASGQLWARVIESSINAAWFYGGPVGNTFGDGTGVAITAADQAANPQWIGLPTFGDYPVGPYPVGTTWDYVTLQEWVYACLACRSAPQVTFVGSITGALLTVSQWLTGPQQLRIGQAITGSGLTAGLVVVDIGPSPNTYYVGLIWNTGSLSGITTNNGSSFGGYQAGTVLYATSAFTGPPINVGDQIVSPLYPPATSQYNGVLPGTVITRQVSQAAGASPGGLGSYNVGVLQTAVPSQSMTGVGGPVWNSQPGGAGSNWNLPAYCPNGNILTNQQLVIIARGARIEFAGQLAAQIIWYGNNLGTDGTKPAILFNSLSYSLVDNLTVQDNYGCTAYGGLVSNDHTNGTSGGSAQENTFRNWFLSGTVRFQQTSLLCSISAVAGGAGQGDTQLFLTPTFINATDAIMWGGDNAIANTLIGGNAQGIRRRGVFANGGTCGSMNFLQENYTAVSYFVVPQAGQVQMDGADFWGSGVTSEANYLAGCRSEGYIALVDFTHQTTLQNYTLSSIFPAWVANNHWHIGTILYVGATNYPVAMLVDDGGYPWLQSDSQSTTTVLHFTPSPGWTANQWAGFGIWLRYGSNGYTASNSIVSNTANTITLAAAAPISYPTFWKIFKGGGAGPVNWNGAALGTYGHTVRNASGQAYSVTQGYNVVNSGQVPPNGDWVCVCGAGVFIQPGGPPMVGPLIGKVTGGNNGATGISGTIGNVSSDGTHATLTVTSGPTTGVITPGARISIGQYSVIDSLASPGVYNIFTPFGSFTAGPVTNVVQPPNFALVDSYGNPQISNVSVTDNYGYWGAGIFGSDGGNTWLPIPFNIAYGAMSIKNSYLAIGDFEACGEVNLSSAPYRGPNGINMPTYADGGFNFRELPFTSITPLVQFGNNAAIGTSPFTPVVGNNQGQIGSAPSVMLRVNIAALTLNMPLLGADTSLDQDVLLYAGVANATVTWGSNVKSLNPSVALGATVGLSTIVRMKWVGDGNTAGSWYVMTTQGPL